MTKPSARFEGVAKGVRREIELVIHALKRASDALARREYRVAQQAVLVASLLLTKRVGRSMMVLVFFTEGSRSEES